MKRLISILLSLLLCFNITIVTIATSTESNVVSSNNEKVETLNEETNKITNEIMLMNFIGVRLEEIIRTESTVLLKDTIDLIQKEDMLNLLDAVTDKEIEFEMDENSDEILNEAHKIIYNELYKRLNELKEDKDRFLEESESLYKDALQKYKNEE